MDPEMDRYFLFVFILVDFVFLCCSYVEEYII